MRREEREEEERWRKEYRKKSKAARNANKQPFFNAGKIPPFSRALIAAFIIIHLPLFLIFDTDTHLKAFYTFGFIPGMYTGTFEWSWTALITPVTHAFIHGSWMHLIFNVVMGLVLGMYVEKLFGARTTAIFFTLCTLAGALAYFLLTPFTTAPVIGASGGISGFFGVLIYLTVTQNTGHPITMKFAKKGPWPILFFWALIMIVPGMLMGGMAWQAHLGGYLAGIALIIAMQKGKIRI